MKKIIPLFLILIIAISCTEDFENPLDPTNDIAPSLFVQVYRDTSTTDTTVALVVCAIDSLVSSPENGDFYLVYGVSDERDTDVTIDVVLDNEKIGELHTGTQLSDTLHYEAHLGEYNCIFTAEDAFSNTSVDTLRFKIDDQAVRDVNVVAIQNMNLTSYGLRFEFESICGIDAEKLNTEDSRIFFSIDNGSLDSLVVADGRWSFDPATNAFWINEYLIPQTRDSELNLDYVLYDNAGNRSTGTGSHTVYAQGGIYDDIVLPVHGTFGPFSPARIELNPTKLVGDLAWYGKCEDDSIDVEYGELFTGVYQMGNPLDFSRGSAWSFYVKNDVISESFDMVYDHVAPYIESIDPTNFNGDVLRESLQTVSITFSEEISKVALSRTGDSEPILIENLNDNTCQIPDIILDEELNEFVLSFTDYAGNTGSIPYRLCYYPSLRLEYILLNEVEFFDGDYDLKIGNDGNIKPVVLKFSQLITDDVEIFLGSQQVVQVDVVDSTASFQFNPGAYSFPLEMSFVVNALHPYGSSFTSDQSLQISIDSEPPAIEQFDISELQDIQNLPVQFSIEFTERCELSNQHFYLDGNEVSIPYTVEDRVVTFTLSQDMMSVDNVVDPAGNIRVDFYVTDVLGNIAQIDETYNFTIDRESPQPEPINNQDILGITQFPVSFELYFDELESYVPISLTVNDTTDLQINPSTIANPVLYELGYNNFNTSLLPDSTGNITIEAYVEDNLGNADTIYVDTGYYIEWDNPDLIEVPDFDEFAGIQNDQDILYETISFDEIIRHIVSIRLSDTNDVNITLNSQLNGSDVTIRVVKDILPRDQATCYLDLTVEDQVGNLSTFRFTIPYSFE